MFWEDFCYCECLFRQSLLDNLTEYLFANLAWYFVLGMQLVLLYRWLPRNGTRRSNIRSSKLFFSGEFLKVMIT